MKEKPFKLEFNDTRRKRFVKRVLIYEENKENYTNEELDIIEKSILKKCQDRLREISSFDI